MPKYIRPKDLYEEAFNDGYDAGKVAILKEIGVWLDKWGKKNVIEFFNYVDWLLKGEMPK